MLAGLEASYRESPLVVVIDDDAAIREALRDLLESVGLRVVVFASATDVLETHQLESASCLVLDIRLPRRSGLEVQQQLARAGIETPVIFVSGYADVSMSVKAMKAGALDFLTKPFHDQDMLDAVLRAISSDLDRRLAAERSAHLKARFAQLTAREREVMTLVTEGLLNKQVAGRLGLSEVTVKMHRMRLMNKMDARTLPDLVRYAGALGLHMNSPPVKGGALEDWAGPALDSAKWHNPARQPHTALGVKP